MEHATMKTYCGLPCVDLTGRRSLDARMQADKVVIFPDLWSPFFDYLAPLSVVRELQKSKGPCPLLYTKFPKRLQDWWEATEREFGDLTWFKDLKRAPRIGWCIEVQRQADCIHLTVPGYRFCLLLPRELVHPWVVQWDELQLGTSDPRHRVTISQEQVVAVYGPPTTESNLLRRFD